MCLCLHNYIAACDRMCFTLVNPRRACDERAERRQEFHGAVFLLPTVIDSSGRLHMGINCAHLTASPVPVPLPLLTVFYLLLCLIAATTSMDRLPRSVHPDLPRDEFILNLKHFSVSDLNTLRLDLFNAASDIHSLIPPEWAGIPLVARRDTAIKSASQKLSEDIWLIVSCINNNSSIPRTLL